MDLEIIKEYLQNYVDSVLIPKINTDESLIEPITMNVTDVLKGSYQPPIYHVFIQIEPHDTLKSLLKKSETDIADFFKLFSINNKIKVHWNKSPAFKDKEFYGTQDL
jgi:hypothetical protein